ncbi:MAG: 3-phosphoshikimate 1-carboxyvinyltransferase [Fimbriimonadaceae bacterium]
MPNSEYATMPHELRIVRPASLVGEFRPPSDKSLTHRAYLFAAIADGPSCVRAPLVGEDCEATLRALQAMGLTVERRHPEELLLTPAPEWRPPSGDVDCGNSGTTMRLLAGLIASRPIAARLVGDASLSRRPMKRIAVPLRLMGAEVEGDTPPLSVRGRADLTGIDYVSPVASAQVKSAVLLAGLRASGETWVSEPNPSRDHTERMLAGAGVEVLGGPGRVGVRGGSRLRGFEFEVPADISSAAFFMVAAAMLPETSLVVRDLDVNPTRTGLLDVFAQVGVPTEIQTRRESFGEPVADLAVGSLFGRRGPGGGRPFAIEGALVPRLVDEIPVLAVLATQLEGVSHIRDARELRVKESDRIEVVAQGLRAMGAKVETREDGMSIEGPTRLRGARIDAVGDHRIAMAFAVAGLVADGETLVSGAEAIATSYPQFESHMHRLLVW